jgi:tetratricopeptide (TPR) repeat protein
MGKWTWIGISVAVMMAGTAWSAPATSALIAEAQAALDTGDAQHAANLANDALKEEGVSPAERARLLLYRGLAEELLGSADPAMRDFTVALEAGALPAEEREQALLQRGFLRDGLGQLDQAAKDYTAVIALKGDSLATALNNRANIYRRQSRFLDAQRDYRAALSAADSKPQYSWYGLGQIAEARGDTVSARGSYAKAVAADPGYVLAFERLQALGGPPEAIIADPQDRIVLHPPRSGSVIETVAKARKEEGGTIVLRAPQTSPPAEIVPIVLHPPRHEAPARVDSGSFHAQAASAVVLRPALDQPAPPTHLERSSPAGTPAEVQLGAWRSEGEASAGWDRARRRAGQVLDGLSPHIVTADLPGRGRYYRLRVSVMAGQSRTAFCAGLSAKGVDCLPTRD